MPAKPNYEEIRAKALEFFQANNLGWIENRETGGGYFLAVRNGNEIQHVVVSSCHQEGRLSTHTQIRLWASNVEHPETSAGICAFLLFGQYEATFTATGGPIVLEGMQEAQAALLPWLKHLPTYTKINDDTKKSNYEMRKALKAKAREINRRDGEGWKDEED